MILVIGEALIDLIGSSESKGQYQAVVGGANANVALALARRGEPQKFLGRISGDGFGQLITERLASNGVDLSLAIKAKEQTSLAVATIGEGGSASYSFYLNGTADWAWTKDELPSQAEFDSLGVKCIQYGCLTMAVEPGNQIVSDWLSGLSGLTRSHDLNIRAALGFARERELKRVLEINQYSDIIKASDADLWWLFDRADDADIDDIAHAWSDGGRLVVITRGGDGASLYRNGKRIDVPAPRVRLVDTVGAGDTFMANLLGELMNRSALGDNPRQRLSDLAEAELVAAARFAAIAAGLVCERQGCEPPTKAEVQALLD